MPALALGFTLAATVSRLSRSAMLEVISQDYIRTARAKGHRRARSSIYKHALRNMMVPLLTIIGVFVAIALTGTVLTETVFTRPGLGKMLVDAIGARDYPLAQGAITVFTMIIIVGQPGRRSCSTRSSTRGSPTGSRSGPVPMAIMRDRRAEPADLARRRIARGGARSQRPATPRRWLPDRHRAR